MRHGRRTLRATAWLPIVAVLLVTPLTSAACDPDARSGDPRPPGALHVPAVASVPGSPSVLDTRGLPVRLLMGATGTVGTGTAADGEEDEAARVPETEKSPEDHGTSHPSHDPATARGDSTPTRERAHRLQRTASAHPHRSPSPVRREHSRTSSGGERPDGSPRSSAPSPDSAHGAGGHGHRTEAGTRTDAGTEADLAGGGGQEAADALFGTHDLYEHDPLLDSGGTRGNPESGTRPGHAPTEAATGETSPVLPLGAGLTSIGLGLAALALRLRRG